MIRDWNPPRLFQPAPHLSAGRLLTPQRYVVGWVDGVVKIGNTNHGQRRWGTFLARGGQMLDLAEYGELIHGLEAEQWLQAQINKKYRRAFTDRIQAAERLGNRGAGWYECYAIPTEDWPQLINLARTD